MFIPEIKISKHAEIRFGLRKYASNVYHLTDKDGDMKKAIKKLLLDALRTNPEQTKLIPKSKKALKFKYQNLVFVIRNQILTTIINKDGI